MAASEPTKPDSMKLPDVISTGNALIAFELAPERRAGAMGLGDMGLRDLTVRLESIKDEHLRVDKDYDDYCSQISSYVRFHSQVVTCDIDRYIRSRACELVFIKTGVAEIADVSYHAIRQFFIPAMKFSKTTLDASFDPAWLSFFSDLARSLASGAVRTRDIKGLIETKEKSIKEAAYDALGDKASEARHADDLKAQAIAVKAHKENLAKTVAQLVVADAKKGTPSLVTVPELVNVMTDAAKAATGKSFMTLCVSEMSESQAIALVEALAASKNERALIRLYLAAAAASKEARTRIENEKRSRDAKKRAVADEPLKVAVA